MPVFKLFSFDDVVYFHHVPKASCHFCRKQGRNYVREQTYYLAPNQSVEFDASSKNCEYHNIVSYLQNKPDIISGFVHN